LCRTRTHRTDKQRLARGLDRVKAPRRRFADRGNAMKPTYFDLTVHDLGAARCFFESVLGWRFERFSMPYEYYRINAGADSEPGIDGGIGAIAATPVAGGLPGTTLTVPVPSLDAALARVAQAGGCVIEPRMPIPGIGWYATCAEPGGLRFGLIEADAAAA
jgi:predicted enzyme related to lactoylglutathione lyase